LATSFYPEPRNVGELLDQVLRHFANGCSLIQARHGSAKLKRQVRSLFGPGKSEVAIGSGSPRKGRKVRGG
jgi:hypothetical protein